MQILRHITANSIELKEMPFQRELSMEAYLIENENVLALDKDTFSSVEVIDAELTLEQGRKSKDTDGRIDILVSYSEEVLGIVELKLGALEKIHLTQLEDYLVNREKIIDEYPESISEGILENPKWIGVLVGTSISKDLEEIISSGYVTEQNIPVSAKTIRRYRSDDGQIFVVCDTYFRNTSAKDYTKYDFNGESLGKGKLVLEVVRQYVKDNPEATYAELERIFPKRLRGSVKKRPGVFSKKEVADQIYSEGSRKRHFLNPEDIIQLSDGPIAVSNQWGIKNIDKFIEAATQLGYKIN